MNNASKLLEKLYPYAINQPQKASVLFEQSNIMFKQNKYGVALELAKKCFVMKQSLLTTDLYPEIAESCLQIANCQINLGHTKRAREYYFHAVKIIDLVYELSPIHPEKIPLLIQLAETSMALNMSEKALCYYAEGLSIISTFHHGKHYLVSKMFEGLADIYTQRGSCEIARGLLEKDVAVLQQYYGQGVQHPDIINAHKKLEVIHNLSARNKSDEAMTPPDESVSTSFEIPSSQTSEPICCIGNEVYDTPLNSDLSAMFED